MNADLPTLLVYDPDPSLGEMLQEQLEGWHVRVAASPSSLEAETAKAVLLAGPGDHTAICQTLRQSGMIGPIFSLNEEAPAPLVALSRPLRLSALVSRLATPDASAVDGVVIGPWRLDLAQRALTQDERVERLTDKEFSLLELLLQAKGETIDARRLQTEIWRYHAEADSHTVETHVWRLRQKLEVDPANPQFLQTGSDGYYIKTV